MFYSHVYVCIVHILCMKMHYYFLLNIKHGTSQLYLGPKYNYVRPWGKGRGRGVGGGIKAPGEGPMRGPRGASNSLAPALPRTVVREVFYFARDAFFRQVPSELPLSIAVKLCHMIGNWLGFTN